MLIICGMALVSLLKCEIIIASVRVAMELVLFLDHKTNYHCSNASSTLQPDVYIYKKTPLTKLKGLVSKN